MLYGQDYALPISWASLKCHDILAAFIISVVHGDIPELNVYDLSLKLQFSVE